MSWSKEIMPLSKFKNMPEKTVLKMRFSGEEYPEKEIAGRGRKQICVSNPYKEFFKEYAGLPISQLPRPVEDVIVCVSRLNWYRKEGEQKPLSVKKILYILGKFDEIDRNKVEWMLDVKSSQANLYKRACELCIQNFERSEEVLEIIEDAFELSDDFLLSDL